MKCIEIKEELSCPGGDLSSAHDMTWEEFLLSSAAKTRLGRLLLDLVEEVIWSREYEVRAFFGRDSFLIIRHKSFLLDFPLTIHDDGHFWPPRRVETMVREHLHLSEETLFREINDFMEKVAAMQSATNRITTDKAKAAILEVFPEAGGAKDVVDSLYGLCAFAAPLNRAAIFVARLIDGEPAGGVAQIRVSPFDWKQTKYGISDHERLGMFWVALAKAFAARELHGLGITEESLEAYHAGIIAQENPDMEQKDPYIVRKIILRYGSTPEIVVVFGSDNLPAKVLYEPE